MSANPSRRLQRYAMRECGWRCETPKSGRRRGATKKAALERVGLIVDTQKAKLASRGATSDTSGL